MIAFHETGYGKRYYEYQLPELIKQITRIAESLEKVSNIKEAKRVSKEVNKSKDDTKNITKVSTGGYNLSIKTDNWYLYRDTRDVNKAWRAECISGQFKDVINLKKKIKRDILNSIYDLYAEKDDAPGIS